MEYAIHLRTEILFSEHGLSDSRLDPDFFSVEGHLLFVDVIQHRKTSQNISCHLFFDSSFLFDIESNYCISASS